MSRYDDRKDDLELPAFGSALPLSKGCGGASGANALAAAEGLDLGRLVRLIDEAAKDSPTLPELMDRLLAKGVRAIPSIQSSGRLNGMSYEVDGQRVKGSRLGRAYTAQGLQERRGVRYEPGRDDAQLRASISQDQPTGARVSGPARSDGRRVRDQRAGRSYDLRLSERELLAEAGRFRTVAVDDLIRYRYAGNRRLFEADVRSLREQELLQIRRVPIVACRARARGIQHRAARSGAAKSQTLNVVVLSKQGQKLAREQGLHGPHQALYGGLVKPGEVLHDAAVYRMFQQEAERIQQVGGRVRQVVLDFELKQRVYRPLATARSRGATAAEYAREQERVAAQQGLRVVQGSIPLPDLRIEYEDEQGGLGKVDLELATEHYKRAQLQVKAAAGFKVYMARTHPGSSPEDYDHITELMSL